LGHDETEEDGQGNAHAGEGARTLPAAQKERSGHKKQGEPQQGTCADPVDDGECVISLRCTIVLYQHPVTDLEQGGLAGQTQPAMLDLNFPPGE